VTPKPSSDSCLPRQTSACSAKSRRCCPLPVPARHHRPGHGRERCWIEASPLPPGVKRCNVLNRPRRRDQETTGLGSGSRTAWALPAFGRAQNKRAGRMEQRFVQPSTRSSLSFGRAHASLLVTSTSHRAEQRTIGAASRVNSSQLRSDHVPVSVDIDLDLSTKNVNLR
jgi:hypothetical protein